MYRNMFTIDSDRCTGCGACVDVCPVGAIRLNEGERGNLAAIDQKQRQQCGACVEACPEKAIVPMVKGEIVQVETRLAPAPPQSRQVQPARFLPQAIMWLGPVVAFWGREIVPRTAAALLDAWDRRSDRSGPVLNDLASRRSAQRSMPGRPAGMPRGGRRRRRWRGGG